MNQVIVFKKVKEEHGWLSNMSPHPVKGYRTAEAFFQASRFEGHPEIQKEIRECRSPMSAKMTAKKYLDKATIQPRSVLDVSLMEHVVEDKLKANPELVELLLATGDREIIEDVTNRPNESGLFWGKAWDGQTWKGENHLGKIWMAVRERIRGDRLHDRPYESDPLLSPALTGDSADGKPATP